MRSAEPLTTWGSEGSVASRTCWNATRVASCESDPNSGKSRTDGGEFHIVANADLLSDGCVDHVAYASIQRVAQKLRYVFTMSAGAQNGSSGMPIIFFVALTCSVVNGFPCASCLSVKSGDGNPTCERSTTRVGDPVCSFACRSANSSASQSSAISPASITFQPYERKRAGTSSEHVSDVDPSIVILLSSNMQIKRSSLRWPASDAAS